MTAVTNLYIKKLSIEFIILTSPLRVLLAHVSGEAIAAPFNE